MASAPMPLDPRALSAARALYLDAYPRQSLRSIAEECGLPYGRVRQLARAQRWELAARVRWDERAVARERAAYSRALPEAARVAERLAKVLRRPSSSLRDVYQALREAHVATGTLWQDTGTLAFLEDRLATLRAGRIPERGATGPSWWGRP